MSEKEIKEIKRNLPKWQDRTEEDKLMYEEMNLRSMIMSCLCYGDNDIYTDKYTIKYKDILGNDRFMQVCKEQEEYFRTKCRVEYNVFTDSEGLTYNTIIELE